MLKPILLSLLPAAFMFSAAASAAESDVFATERGTWVTIYMNDFVGMQYAAGVSKAQTCVSEAARKASEFSEQGMNVSQRLLMSEMAAFEVTGRDKFMIYCNANSALVVDMMLSGNPAEAMARRENAGTAARSAEPQPATSETQVDLTTGKSKTTTTIPQP